MKINQEISPIIDSFYYTVNYFNLEAVRSWLKIYAKNEDDILDHYYEFRKIYEIDPPENLYPFFYFDIRNSSIIISYLDNNFPDINYTAQSVLELFQDKDKFKRFVYYYYLDCFKKDVDIELVIKGDSKNTSLAAALLSSIYTDYPKQFYGLIYNFNELVDELISYLKNTFHKAKLFHNKKKNVYETVVADFLKSTRVNEISKSFYNEKSLDFSKQIYGISFFRRYIVNGSPIKNDQVTLIVGDKCSNAQVIYANYSHVTDISSALIFATDAMRDIISALTKGEKSITQLFHMLNYARPTIDKFVGLLNDELAIKVSRKSGNEYYYEINYAYFQTAQTVLYKACEMILKSRK